MEEVTRCEVTGVKPVFPGFFVARVCNQGDRPKPVTAARDRGTASSYVPTIYRVDGGAPCATSSAGRERSGAIAERLGTTRCRRPREAPRFPGVGIGDTRSEFMRRHGILLM